MMKHGHKVPRLGRPADQRKVCARCFISAYITLSCWPLPKAAPCAAALRVTRQSFVHTTAPALPCARTPSILRRRLHSRGAFPSLTFFAPQALLRALTTEVLRHGAIKTTVVKAKAVRPWVDKIILLAKAGGKDKMSQAKAWVYDAEIVNSLFEVRMPNPNPLFWCSCIPWVSLLPPIPVSSALLTPLCSAFISLCRSATAIARTTSRSSRVARCAAAGTALRCALWSLWISHCSMPFIRNHFCSVVILRARSAPSLQ